MGKVGLVLVGGAIKGAYEAGVLKALAHVGLAPDVIVGISAGALNGTFAAQAIAHGQFTSERVEKDLASVWRDRVTALNFYDAHDPRKLTARERPPLSQLFQRLGIDPLRRQYRPRWSFDALFAFEQLVKGEFSSLMSHGFMKDLFDTSLTPPRTVRRPVTLSVVTTNLMGSTELTGQGLETRYSHFEEFTWRDQGAGEWESMFRRLRLLISASSAFPCVFPPVTLGTDGDVGSFVDGGLMDCSPIGRALGLDPEVDTVLVVLGATAVGRPSDRPETMLKTLTRVFTLLGGKFVIQNYQKVLKVNRQLKALRQVLEQDDDGRVLPTERNQLICEAAGFAGLPDFMRRREVRLIPIFPDPALPGDIFDGFFDRDLRSQYVERGYEDGLAAVTREAGVNQDLAGLMLDFQREVEALFNDPVRIKPA